MSLDTDTGGLFSDYGLSLAHAADGSEIVHDRTKVRDFFVARLISIVEDPLRVQSEPTLPLQARPGDWKLPALNVFTRNEESAISSSDLMRRELELVVAIIGARTAAQGDVERLIDSIAMVVERVMLAQQDLPFTQMDIVLESTTREFENAGDTSYRFGACSLSFRITYYSPLPDLAAQPN